MLEADLQSRVMDLCVKYKLRVFHCEDSRWNKGTSVGFPDLVIVGTSLLFAELKTNYGNLSGPQTNWRYRLQAAGVKHVVWRPRDLESGDIEAVLRSISQVD